MSGGEIRLSTCNAFSFYMILCIHMTSCSGSLDFWSRKISNSLNMKLKQRILKRIFLEQKGTMRQCFNLKEENNIPVLLNCSNGRV